MYCLRSYGEKLVLKKQKVKKKQENKAQMSSLSYTFIPCLVLLHSFLKNSEFSCIKSGREIEVVRLFFFFLN